jgi:hypothetical protein
MRKICYISALLAILCICGTALDLGQLQATMDLPSQMMMDLTSQMNNNYLGANWNNVPELIGLALNQSFRNEMECRWEPLSLGAPYLCR